MTTERVIKAKSGWAMLVVNILIYLISVFGIVWGIIMLATADSAGIEPPVMANIITIGGLRASFRCYFDFRWLHCAAAR